MTVRREPLKTPSGDEGWFNAELEKALTSPTAPTKKADPWREAFDLQKGIISTLQEQIQILKDTIAAKDRLIDGLEQRHRGPAC